MALIIKQLEMQQVISPGESWDKANFTRLAENAWLWRVQYRAYCAHLIAHFNQSKPDTKETKETLKTTLFMAELLEALHERLNEIPAKAKFSQDKIILKKLLKQSTDTATDDVFNLPGIVQNVTYNSDTTRLLIGNLRRICLGLLAYPETFGHELTWAEQFSSILGPILTIAGFLVYLPRTIVNGIVLPTRLSENQSIPLKSRIQAHSEIDDRLFNLINDSPSVLAGFLTVCLLPTPMLWIGVYMTVAVKLCEVIFAATKSYYDISRLYAMRAEYDQQQHLSEHDKDYLKHLDSSIAYTKGARYTTTAMHTLLLPCLAAFTPPIMMLHPAVPILAAIFAISLVCLRFPDFRDFWIAEPPPQDNLKALGRNHHFFKSITEEPSDGTEAHDLNFTF